MKKSETGFVILMAFLMSLTALSIDAMLPALGSIQESLKIENNNHVQLVISMIFFGMSFGLIIYGPLSDAYGRKKPLYAGLIIFVFGSFLSYVSTSLEIMLIGRFLQGFGSSSSRIITIAMIRDRFSGVEMAKIMSLIMVIFIIVPALAPSLGQLIIYFLSWKAIFGVLICMGLIGIFSLRFKLEETHKFEHRAPLSFLKVYSGIKETVLNPVSRGYTLASGLVFGAFVAYLSLVQPILQVKYKLGDSFSFYFGALALFIGFSSFLNSRLVGKFGMKSLTNLSLIAVSVISAIFLLILYLSGGEVSFYIFLSYLGILFLFIGILFGNLGTLAIEPLGHIAGTANSVISSIQTFISVLIAIIVGQFYSGSLYPLIIAFCLLGALSYFVILISVPNDK